MQTQDEELEGKDAAEAKPKRKPGAAAGQNIAGKNTASRRLATSGRRRPPSRFGLSRTPPMHLIVFSCRACRPQQSL